MDQQAPASLVSTGVRSSRQLLRITLATLAVLVGAAYVLIALQVVHVADTSTDGAIPYLTMAAAGAAFFLGAVLLVLTDRRIVYLLGAAVQILVLVGYFAMASIRDPKYESWGLTMKAAQIALLALLPYLALTTPGAQRGGRRAAEPR